MLILHRETSCCRQRSATAVYACYGMLPCSREVTCGTRFIHSRAEIRTLCLRCTLYSEKSYEGQPMSCIVLCTTKQALGAAKSGK